MRVCIHQCIFSTYICVVGSLGVLNHSIYFPFHVLQGFSNDLMIQQRLNSLQQQITTLQAQQTSTYEQFATFQDQFSTLESSVQSMLVTLQTRHSRSNAGQPTVPRVMSGRSTHDNNVTTSARGAIAIRTGPAAIPVRNSARGIGLSRTVANPVKK
jgi:flagellar capping protein FliD